MPIEEVTISNFRSFSKQKIVLRRFNVIIGGNASGKSNLVQLFKFLRDAQTFGLDNAVSMQGGDDNITNFNVGKASDLKISLVCSPTTEYPNVLRFFDDEPVRFCGIFPKRLKYDLSIGFKRRGKGIRSVTETVSTRGSVREFSYSERRTPHIKVLHDYGEGSVVYTNENGKFDAYKTFPKDAPEIEDETLLPPQFRVRIRPGRRTLLAFNPYEMLDFSENLGIYDFDPKLPKKGIPFSGKKRLEEDGGNLAIVMRSIAEQTETKRQFVKLLQRVLPFLDTYGFVESGDKSVLLKFNEKYWPDKDLYAPFVSDGTLSIVALLVALHFEQRNVMIFEEPERNVHPKLMSKLMRMMKEASRERQIIITTHNPEIVRQADLEDLLFIARKRNGDSKCTRPEDSKQVMTFLKHNLGKEELFIDNLLGK